MAQICMATDGGGGGCSGSAPPPRRTYRRRRYTRRYKRAYRRAGKTLYKRQKRVVKKKMSRFLLAQIDPFHPMAEGCKIPDSNTFPSTPVRADDTISVQPAAGGSRAVAFRPWLKNTSILGTYVGAQSWSWPASFGGGTDSSRLTAINSSYSSIRPVAHGVRIYCPVAPLNAVGFVHVGIYVANYLGDTTWDLPTDISQLSNCMFYNRFPLSLLTQKALTITNKFVDITSTRYVSPNSTVSANATDLNIQTEGWGTIVIAVEGQTVTTAVLTCEQLVHYEALPLATGVNTATPAAAYDPEAIATASRIVSTQEAATLEGERPAAGMLMNAVNSGVVDAYGDYIAPALSYAGQTVGYAAGAAAAAGIVGVTNRLMPTSFARNNGRVLPG